MKLKRPTSFWIIQTVLLLIAGVSAFTFYFDYVLLSYYSLEGHIWTRFQSRFDFLASLSCLIALVGLWFRYRSARWLSIVVLFFSGCLGVYSVVRVLYRFFSDGPRDPGYVLVQLSVITFVIFVIAFWLVASARARNFFESADSPFPDESLTLPPPPPTFDT